MPEQPKTKLPTTQDIIAEPQTPPEGSEPTAEIPEEVLNIPAIYGLLNGAPPAVYAEKTAQDSEVQTVVKHSKELIDAGFGFYPSQDGKLTVLYNGAYVSDKDLKKADEAGTLTEVVPSFESVKSNFDAAVSGTPPEGGNALPGQPAATAAPSVAVGGAPPSSRTQNTLATARTNNIPLGSPTSGPVPGRGRIMNEILKPVI